MSTAILDLIYGNSFKPSLTPSAIPIGATSYLSGISVVGNNIQFGTIGDYQVDIFIDSDFTGSDGSRIDIDLYNATLGQSVGTFQINANSGEASWMLPVTVTDVNHVYTVRAVTFSSLPGTINAVRIYAMDLGGGGGGISTATLPLIITGPNIALGTATGPAVTDVNSSVTWSPSGAASKGLVIQGKATQSANLIEIQDSTGAATAYFDSVGRLSTNRLQAPTGSSILEIFGYIPMAGNVSGGSIEITSGAGSGTGAGGNLLLNAGESGGGATGNGGSVAIVSGPAISTDGNGGEISLTASTGTGTGQGGNVVLNSGVSSFGNGGDLAIAAGASTIAGNGGNVTIFAGSSAGSNGGNVTINAGAGTGSDGTLFLGTGDTVTISIGATGVAIPTLGTFTFEDDVRQTFNPGAANPGFNVGSHAGDPSTPINGDLWYNTASSALRARINNVTVALGGSLTGFTTASNTALGTGAGDSITTSTGNTIVGVNAGTAITTTVGTDHVLIGENAGQTLTTGTDNVMVGKNAGSLALSGSRNTYTGGFAGENALGSDNTLTGYLTANAIANGDRNSIFGSNAAGNTGTITLSDSAFFGYNAGFVNTANQNTFIGSSAGAANTSSTGHVHVGYQAGLAVTGANNTIVGHQAGDGVTTGVRNSLFGKDAGGAAGATAMSDVVALGYQAGLLNTGDQNTFVGSSSGDANTSGSQQAFFGYNSGSQATGSSNTILGANSAINLTTGSTNVFIGASSDAASGSTSNAIGIMAIAESNTFVAGNTSTAISNVYFGQGITRSSPSSYTINGTGGSGTNNAGAALQLAGGKGTGTAEPGLVVIKYPLKTTTGTTLQSLSTQSYPISTTLLTGNTSTVLVTASVVGTTQTTLLGSIVGSPSLEAGMLRIGRSIRFTASGTLTTSAATVPTFRLRVKKGTVSMAEVLITVAASQTNATWSWTTTLNTRTLGAPGNVFSRSIFYYYNTVTALVVGSPEGTSGNVDTTATENVDFTIEFGNSTVGNSIACENVTVEILN
jgi:hypothetical protein